MPTHPEYSSQVLQLASDDTYNAQGDAYDGTATKTTPALSLITQNSRPNRQLSAKVRNWIDREIAKVLTALISDASYFSAAANPVENGTRITVSSTESVPSADVVGATTVYIRRHAHSTIWLYDQTSGLWIPRQVSSSSVPVVLSGLTAGNNYDLYAYWDGANVALEVDTANPWSGSTPPTLPITGVGGGVAVKGITAALLTRRYVGSIRATSATTTEDSKSKRFVCNAANRVRRFLAVTDSTASWNYTTAAWRQTNNAPANKVEYLVRDAGGYVEARAKSIAASGTANTLWATGIGIDSTTVNSAQFSGNYEPVAAYSGADFAEYLGASAAGNHAINWLEYGGTTVGFLGNSAPRNVGLVASVDM